MVINKINLSSKKRRVLGLDASTTTIGLSVLSYDEGQISLDHSEYFKPPKKVDIFERLAVVRKYIIEKIDEFKPDDVVLEDIILFMAGNSTAKTISSLAVLNRTVGLAVYEKTGTPPFLFNVMKIRHAIKEDKKLRPKEEIPELVARILDIDFPYVLSKRGSRVKENFDIADSIACALCHIFLERKNNKT